jgi:hypothetical protein
MSKHKSEIWNELKNMQVKAVQLENICLDPNNPRLETPRKTKINDERVEENTIQEECLRQLRQEGISDLTESIRTCGFWTVDRIVLRLLKSKKFIVVEGNRRIAALKTLKTSHEKGQITIDRNIYTGILGFEVLLYTGQNPNIAWIIQGFRHTPGIKSWDRYPQSKFFADFERESKKSLHDMAAIFGITAKDITHLVRSFYAFEQAKEDDEYGDMLGPEKFGHFDEIILRKDVLKEWMGWSDEKRKFTETKCLKKYLSWATAEAGEKPKIDISPATRDVLPKLIQEANKSLLDKFDAGLITLRQCEEELFKEETKREPINILDTIKHLGEAKKIINTLPIPQLRLAKTKEEMLQKEQLKSLLEEINEILQIQIGSLKKK